jgi:hypothetical protein
MEAGSETDPSGYFKGVVSAERLERRRVRWNFPEEATRAGWALAVFCELARLSNNSRGV